MDGKPVAGRYSGRPEYFCRDGRGLPHNLLLLREDRNILVMGSLGNT